MNVLFLYLGRRGPLGQFTLELSHAAEKCPGVTSIFALSKSNPIAAEDAWRAGSLVRIDTFDSAASLATLTRFFTTRRHLAQIIRDRKVDAVVTLMPHLWTPLLVRSVHACGAKYATVIHDFEPHPGDPTAMLTPWLRREARSADLVVTLSRAVGDRLVGAGYTSRERLLPLLLPDLHQDAGTLPPQWRAGTPLRLLFFGRILAYKGLPLLVEAIEILRKEGVDVRLGVAGGGNIGDLRKRLAALDAEVTNRWIDNHEIPALFARYDAVALPYVEASQSAVASIAFGRAMPVVATPAGGIKEQVLDEETGVLASGTNARALADAIRRLARDPALYERISSNLRARAESRSMRKFAQALFARLVDLDGQPIKC